MSCLRWDGWGHGEVFYTGIRLFLFCFGGTGRLSISAREVGTGGEHRSRRLIGPHIDDTPFS